MLNYFEKHPITTIVALTFIMMLPNLDALQVTIMEARNFISAREMLTDGNWILTTMNGEPRYQKPPLPTWLCAISAMAFGIKSVFAMRLPTVFMVAITGVFVYKLSYVLTQRNWQSLINGLITITSFYIIGITIEGPWDIYTHGFMLIAIYYLVKSFKSQEFSHTVLIAGLCFGASVLSKGPVSLYALFLPFVIAYAVRYGLKKHDIFKLITVLIIGIVIGGWWFAYVRYADPETFLKIATRETSNWSSYNVRPFYYYWSFFTQSGIWTIPAFVGLLYPYLKTRVSHANAYKFSFWWTIIAVILLSVIPEKKSRYLMPVLIPLAINTGFYIEYLTRKFSSLTDKKETLPVYFNFGLIGLIGIAIPIALFVLLKDAVSEYLFTYILSSLVALILGILIFINLKQKHLKPVFIYTVLFFVGLLATSKPLIKAFNTNENYKPIADLKASTNNSIYSNVHPAPEVIWEYGDNIKIITQQPNDNIFGLLTKLNQKQVDSMFTNYTSTLKTTYDINTTTPDKRAYKMRYKIDYYLLKRNN